MGEVIQYGSLKEHVTALTLADFPSGNIDVLQLKIGAILEKTKTLGMLPADVISRAIVKAMIPDPTLEFYDDIYMVPRGQMIEVSFSHNYLQKLAMKSGAVKVFNVTAAYKGDTIKITQNGLEFNIDPFRASAKDEDLIGVVVQLTLANGEIKYGAVTRDHIDKARSASKMKGGGPWKLWFVEMAKKVAIKNTLKGIWISDAYNQSVDIDNEEYKGGRRQVETIADEDNSNTFDSLAMSTAKSEFISLKVLNDNDIKFEEKAGWVKVDEDLPQDLKSKYAFVKKSGVEGSLFIQLEDPSIIDMEVSDGEV